MAKLYELTEAYLTVKNLIEQGEELEGILETLSDEIEVKADNYANIMTEIEGDIATIDKEIERLRAKKGTLANGVERLKNNLYMSMVQTGKTKFKVGTRTFAIQKNGGKLPLKVNEALVPMEWKKAEYRIDTDRIREALEAGEVLDFAELGERGEGLRIR